ncbi:DUF1015 domain-containing protein [Maribacter polysiphoniae]|uniref:DUF1015 domain-containing protein n=1 Tax=Maribacter polysiphoniae TaxID=429344 RepID=A0A316E461_9FLAO|nr:DUF1015 domain-containing protein [Maribacter polysiphoniae]MBD1261255.1 DUF1015 domain-containing protein [Maribacter polysiphoniae]PWK23503.1 uncharacterized protein (DUF1015 family) [Maribacter polysiphoniae]
MAVIKPFKAVRPTKDKVAHVTSRSYQEYSEEELEATLRFNPFSFLHIINPGYKFSKEVSGEERFKLVHNRYLEFLEDNIFLKDSKDSFYIYQIEKNNFKTCGFFCATSVQDYRDDIIKKHEDTLSQREQLFAKYLNTVGFNAEPVLITYSDNDSIQVLIDLEKQKKPEYFFTTPDKIKHSLWVVSNTDSIQKLICEFKKIDSLYIADGHHRSASSNVLARMSKDRNPNHTGKEPYNYFMSYLIPESEIRIYEFNRMVRDLNGLTKEEFLIRLDAFFRMENKGSVLYKPSKKHHFSMYLDGDFYSLFLRKKVYGFTDTLSQLDTQILYKTILEPILGIKDLRNDERIHYGCGKHNVIQMKDDIDNGKFQVGFGLVPLKINELKAIADAGLVMPPKSTYIEPKLRSGMAIYEF